MDGTDRAVAVITGGGAGFGAAIAERCRAADYAVALLDIDGDAAEATAGGIRSAGGNAIARAVDVSDRQSLEAAADAVRSQLGRCDLLFANVGVQQFGTLDRFAEPDWRWMLSVNLLGVIHTVQAFLPLVRATTGERHIVLTSSVSVLAPSPRIGPTSSARRASPRSARSSAPSSSARRSG